MPQFPDAIFAGNDTVALDVMNYAQNNQIKLPNELKIVGYSNDPLTEIVSPKISSIEQYPYEIGVQSASLMLDLIQHNNKRKNFFTITIPVDIIERDSSKSK